MTEVTITLTNAQVKMLKNLLDAFETGSISNPSKWAQRERTKYESWIRTIVAQLP